LRHRLQEFLERLLQHTKRVGSPFSLKLTLFEAESNLNSVIVEFEDEESHFYLVLQIIEID
jgi:hypothetical protein